MSPVFDKLDHLDQSHPIPNPHHTLPEYHSWSFLYMEDLYVRHPTMILSKVRIHAKQNQSLLT